VIEAKTLRNAPSTLDTPTYSAFKGDSVWGFHPSIKQRLREKKWQWFSVFDEKLALGGAIVDVGYVSKVFLWIFDRENQTWWLDGTQTLGPKRVFVANDVNTRNIAHGGGLKIMRDGSIWKVLGHFEGAKLDLTFTATAPPMTALCPTPVGWNVTRKQVSLSVAGVVRGIGEHKFHDATGFLDHSHGIMARHTSWLWALGGGQLADGIAIGFNAISGFNGDMENAIWVGDDVFGFERAEFTKGASWRVKDSKGMIDLELDIEAVRTEDLDLKLVKSKYEQPLGIWRGTLAGHEVSLVGVAEDHMATW